MTHRRRIVWSTLALALLAACGETDGASEPSIEFDVVRGGDSGETPCADELAVLFEGPDFVVCGPLSGEDLAVAIGQGVDADELELDVAPTQVLVPAEPTFFRHITPILDAHCWSCHGEGADAATPLVEYDAIVGYGAELREGLLEGDAPHRLVDANKECVELEGLRPMSLDEIGTIVQWIDAGMAEGSPNDGVRPESMSIAVDWTVAAPSYAPADNERRCFMVEAGDLGSSGFVRGFEAVVSDPTLVLGAFVAAYDETRLREIEALAASSSTGWACDGVPPEGRGIGLWSRGIGGFELPDGAGVPVSTADVVVMEVTYLESDTPVDVRFELELANSAQAARILRVEDRDFVVPFGEASGRTYDQVLFSALGIETAVEITAVFPRVGALGVGLDASIVDDEGERCLVQAPDVPVANWSTPYVLTTAETVDPEDGLTLACEFDTTSVSAPVRWGYDRGEDTCSIALLVVQ